MKQAILVLLLAVAACITGTAARQAKYRGAKAAPVPVEKAGDLPKEFTWCNVKGRNYCGPTWNQNVPEFCDSSYLHAALHTANDRIRVLKGAGSTPVLLARQVFLNCGQKYGLGNGCKGGSPADVFEFMFRYGLPDETCQIYKARPGKCDELGWCANCMPLNEEFDDTKCWGMRNFTRYWVTEYGHVSGEKQIMAEIYARGPVTCLFSPDASFAFDYDGGVWKEPPMQPGKNAALRPTHAVEVVGWGENRDGEKYWWIRNSWGDFWGLNGFFKLLRGENHLGIESLCSFPLVDASEELRLTGPNRTYVGGMYALRPIPDCVKKTGISNCASKPGVGHKTERGIRYVQDRVPEGKKPEPPPEPIQ